MASRTEFHLGITMSGAISAGAYTAGVLDFLIEALDQWEAALAGPNGSTVPNHLIGLKVMSGASAGAITAAIGAIALVDDQHASVYVDRRGKRFPYYLPKLYQSWVVKPALVAEGSGETDLLSLGDLDEPVGPSLFPNDFSHSSNVLLPNTGQVVPVGS